MGLIKLLFTSRATLLAAYRCARDPHVPARLKLLAVLGALLILSPLNILEYVPLLGIVDDVVLFGLLLSWFVRAAERSRRGPFIDGTALAVPSPSAVR